MLLRPMKRICPSVNCVARSNTPRHFGGLMKGSTPSTTSISAKAPSSKSQTLVGEPKGYFFAAAAAAAAADGAPRMAWKN